MPPLDRSLSVLSLASTSSSRQDSEDDWDRSLILPDLASTPSRPCTPPPQPHNHAAAAPTTTAPSTPNASSSSSSASHLRTHHTSPSATRNSVVFPSDHTPRRTTRYSTSGAAGAAVAAEALAAPAFGPTTCTDTDRDQTMTREPCAGGLGDEHGNGNGKRTLSDLLRLHSETGCPGKFSPDEASRIADVLGQWINASSSPYEPDTDDFFVPARDDLVLAHNSTPDPDMLAPAGRPRGRSESATPSRPASALGVVGA